MNNIFKIRNNLPKYIKYINIRPTVTSIVSPLKVITCIPIQQKQQTILAVSKRLYTTTTIINSNNNNNNKPKANMLYTPKDRSYEESINALLSLQSNQSVITSWTKERKNNKEECTKYLMEEMKGFCKSLDIDLNKQSIIHVAGTKGKGSTCAFTESIIREHGYTTGLFTSPHLISPRERIKINGELISKELFSQYFWKCWDKLIIDFNTQLPNFFKYLTLMALKIFQDQGVQCTILEVGIGGRMDSTNVFPKPVVTGISALGFDHMNLLGDTLGEIALEKAGIMKTGVPVFTVSSQDDEAMKVLVNHSKNVGSPLAAVPDFSEYQSSIDCITLKGEYQLENSALAIALSNCWLSKQQYPTYQNTKYDYNLNNYQIDQFKTLSKSIENGLKNTNWPGRAQHFTSPNNFPNMDFYLDGAHTPESSIVMLNWWKSVVPVNNNSDDTIYILIFNSTGGRNPNSFLKPIIQAIQDKEIPIFNQTIIPNIIIEKPIDKKYYIKELTSSQPEIVSSEKEKQKQEQEETWEDFVVNCYDKLTNKSHPCIATDSIESSIELAQKLSNNGTKNVKVLITGSLYLVGGVLKVLLKEKSFT